MNTNTDTLDYKDVCSYGVILASETVTSIFSREKPAIHAGATRLNVNIIYGVRHSGMSAEFSRAKECFLRARAVPSRLQK